MTDAEDRLNYLTGILSDYGYRLITNTSKEYMEKKVNEHINLGWKLYGNPGIVSHDGKLHYFQALTFENTQTRYDYRVEYNTVSKSGFEESVLDAIKEMEKRELEILFGK